MKNKLKTTLTLGNHRGNPRFWIEGKALAAAGFEPGTLFAAIFLKGRVELQTSFEGERMVAKRLVRGQLLPIIDINTAQLAASLGKTSRVSVTGGEGKLVIRPA